MEHAKIHLVRTFAHVMLDIQEAHVTKISMNVQETMPAVRMEEHAPIFLVLTAVSVYLGSLV